MGEVEMRYSIKTGNFTGEAKSYNQNVTPAPIDLGTISGYSKQLREKFDKAGGITQGEVKNGSAWAGYFDKLGMLIGSEYKDENSAAVQIGRTTYYDFNKDDKVDEGVILLDSHTPNEKILKSIVDK